MNSLKTRRSKPAIANPVPGTVLAAVVAIGLLAVGCGAGSDTDEVAGAQVSSTSALTATTSSTTEPPPTTSSTTMPPPTTTTSPPTTIPPETLDGTLTWDGETCSFDGPTAANAGDSLNLNMVNDSGRYAFFQVVYLTSDTTLEAATDFFDSVMGNVLNESSPPPPSYLILVHEADDVWPESSGSDEVRLRQAREHVLICSASETNNYSDDRVIYSAAESIVVAG